MKTLILKKGATGDVVRTSALLRQLKGKVTWLTTNKNRVFLDGLGEVAPGSELDVLSWEEREKVTGEEYELVINLEDEPETAAVLKSVKRNRVFGAYLNSAGEMVYSEDARGWFDLSLISRFGRKEADRLKFRNRRSYQDLIFDGLGSRFKGERYCLPPTRYSELQGDVAIAPEAGPVWPMKQWAHYAQLKKDLEERGYTVNYLPKRATLLEHLADVRGHRCVVSGDSLPMHLALGSGIPTVALFNCTSPWEIFDYGLLKKMVAPSIEEFFYKRDFDERATTAIPLSEVFEEVQGVLSDLALPVLKRA